MNGSNKVFIFSVWIFISALIFLKIYSALTLNLFEDEALYWMWSLNPDPSYSYITLIAIKLSSLIFSSDTEAVVRFPALFSNVILIFLLIKISKELGYGNSETLYLILIFFSVPFVTIYTSFISPDTFLLVFTTAVYYFWLKLITSNNLLYYFYSGLSMGLAVMSKYQGAILFLVFILILIINRKKNHYNIRGLIILSVTFALTISPVIIWNFTHEPVWLEYYLFTNADKTSGGIFELIPAFFLSQLSVLLPLIFVLFIYAVFLLIKKSSADSRFGLLKLSCFITFAFLFISSLSGKIKGNWFFVIYIPLILMIPYFYNNKILKTLAVMAALFNLFILTCIQLPVNNLKLISGNSVISFLNSGFTDYWPGSLLEDNSDRNWTERISKMNSWKSNIGRIENEIKKSNVNYDFIASDDFNLAPLIQYYSESREKIYLLNDKRFRYINSAEFNPDLKNKNFIVISYNDDWKKNVSPLFDSVNIITSLNLYYGDTKFNSVTLLSANNFKQD